MQSFVTLYSLVDQAPNDVGDGAADPHREPVAMVWKSSSISGAKCNIAANHGKSQVVNGW